MKNIQELENKIAELEEEIRENMKDSKYQRTKRGALNRRKVKLEELTKIQGGNKKVEEMNNEKTVRRLH